MLINSQNLVGLKVETKSGQYIGRIQSFDIDIDTQGVRCYYVKPKLLLEGGVFSDELKVHQKQVIDINQERMVVMDNIVKYKEKKEKVLAGSEPVET